MKTKITTTALCLTLLLTSVWSTNAKPNEFVFRFVYGNDMFYIPWEGNGERLDSLCKTLDTNILKDGSIHVDGYGRDIDIVRVRCNRLKTELINRCGLNENHFTTTNNIGKFNGMKYVVVVTVPDSAVGASEVSAPEEVAAEEGAAEEGAKEAEIEHESATKQETVQSAEDHAKVSATPKTSQAATADEAAKQAAEAAKVAEIEAQAAEEAANEAAKQAEEAAKVAGIEAQAADEAAKQAAKQAEEAAKVAGIEAKAADEAAKEAAKQADEAAKVAGIEAQAAEEAVNEAAKQAEEAAKVAGIEAQAAEETAKEAAKQAEEAAKVAGIEAQAAEEAAKEAAKQAEEAAKATEKGLIKKSTAETAGRWSVGVNVGVPFFWGDMLTIAADKTYGGVAAGVHGSYRICSLLSTSLSVDYAYGKLGPRGYAKDYLLAQDGMTWYVPQAEPMKKYSELNSKVSLINVGLSLDVNINRFFGEEAAKNRFTAWVSPTVYGQFFFSDVRLKESGELYSNGTTTPAAISLGLGGSASLRYQVCPAVSIQLKNTVAWLTDNNFDAICTPYGHAKQNAMWLLQIGAIWHIDNK